VRRSTTTGRDLLGRNLVNGKDPKEVKWKWTVLRDRKKGVV
jgi:hypothetical protein